MRLTKKLCALVSSFAVGASAQTPAAPGNPQTDPNQLRDALRKALQGETPAPTPAPAERPAPQPVAPNIRTAETPSAPATNVIITAPATRLMTFTNVVYDTNGVATIPLSLSEAIRLALEKNLQLQVSRYAPIISEYQRRGLYGYYDPVFSSGISRAENVREPGGLNLNTGNVTPGTRSETDIGNAGVSGFLPSGMSYEINHNAGRNSVTTPAGTNSVNGLPVFIEDETWNSSVSATATQPLLRDFWIDNPRLQIKLARRNQSIAQLQFERMVMDIVRQVEQAYFGLSAAREQVRAGEADLVLKKQFFDEQHRRVEVGTIAPLDEKLAQAEVARSESILVGLRGRAQDAETLLKSLIEDDLVGLLKVRLVLTDRLMALPVVVDVYDAMREAEKKRPDLQQQRLVLEQWQLRLKYDFNQLFPRFDIFATLGYNGLDRKLSGALGDIRDRNYENSAYGLSISFPLTLWSERNTYKADKAAKEQALWEYKRQTEAVYAQVEYQVRLIGTYWSQIPLTREVTTAQQQALDAERKRFDAGKSTSFQVLEIASGLTAAQVAEIQAILIYNQALSELEFRKGTTLERWRIDVPPPID